eukprot:TRINITY_DN2253_c0_g2_i3.p1 TRINITY_DN2253_c0_g2~~TRINITY_DN2253_c0_g2_i3.p1  ORF type:complete len:548 (+),score=101.23 TRINITY_DN2253_c0_g2_i3:143-1786(+)
MAVLLWWARARVDHWAGRLLLNAPTDDVVLHAKFLQEIEANNQQGRKFWAISLSFITLSLMGFWDAILATLQFVVVPFALMTHSREQFGKLGWLVYYMLLGLLYFRLHWLNHALGKVKDSNGQMFFWLLLVHSWNEFSTSRFSTMALKNLAMLAAVWLQPISRGVVLASWFSLISMALFCYRRRWNTSVCDGMAALVTRQELDQSRQEATLLRTLFHSKSVFLRTLCHELRNPMTAVQGNNEILVRMLSQAIKRGQPRAPRTPDLHCPAPRRTDSSPSTEAECDRLRARVRELEALLASPGEAPGEAGELDLYHELYGELPKMLRFSSNALLSAKHMSDVLNQTLTAAKLESEQGDVGSMPDEDVVCVRECFETATSMFQIVADQKGVELRLVLPAEEVRAVVLRLSSVARGIWWSRRTRAASSRASSTCWVSRAQQGSDRCRQRTQVHRDWEYCDLSACSCDSWEADVQCCGYWDWDDHRRATAAVQPVLTGQLQYRATVWRLWPRATHREAEPAAGRWHHWGRECQAQGQHVHFRAPCGGCPRGQ